MDKINTFNFQIGRRVEVTLEEEAKRQAERDKEVAEWEQEANWMLHPEKFIYHQVFERSYRLFRDCSLDNSPHGKQITKWLGGDNGLYIWGDVGVGKTYLALSCLKWQLARKQTGYIWTASELLDRLRYFIGLKDNLSLEKQVDNYSRLPMLIIDDFGVQATTAWADEQLYEVINRRWLKRDSLITIVTSNYIPEELEQKAKDEIIGGRIVSRIIGMCKVLHIEGKDRRLAKRT